MLIRMRSLRENLLAWGTNPVRCFCIWKAGGVRALYSCDPSGGRPIEGAGCPGAVLPGLIRLDSFSHLKSTFSLLASIFLNSQILRIEKSLDGSNPLIFKLVFLNQGILS